MNRLFLLLLLISIGGCSSFRGVTSWSKAPTDQVVETISPTASSLTVFSAVGGLCMLAGMVLLVVSRGAMGWRPVIGGVILVLLNYMVAEYADWVFIPVLVATGCISAAWSWKVVKSILKVKKENGNG